MTTEPEDRREFRPSRRNAAVGAVSVGKDGTAPGAVDGDVRQPSVSVSSVRESNHERLRNSTAMTVFGKLRGVVARYSTCRACRPGGGAREPVRIASSAHPRASSVTAVCTNAPGFLASYSGWQQHRTGCIAQRLEHGRRVSLSRAHRGHRPGRRAVISSAGEPP
jgi:hypothetical protein